ncbi:hypothetical protein ACFWOG_25540 [Kitasatospora sp. NPDC058406]|uniref:hypothetical protein n=1 Tax=Kitasatospora sp. NPDC058406 TaxID=3346483 RepID=UPI00365EA8A6
MVTLATETMASMIPAIAEAIPGRCSAKAVRTTSKATVAVPSVPGPPLVRTAIWS